MRGKMLVEPGLQQRAQSVAHDVLEGEPPPRRPAIRRPRRGRRAARRAGRRPPPPPATPFPRGCGRGSVRICRRKLRRRRAAAPVQFAPPALVLHPPAAPPPNRQARHGARSGAPRHRGRALRSVREHRPAPAPPAAPARAPAFRGDDAADRGDDLLHRGILLGFGVGHRGNRDGCEAPKLEAAARNCQSRRHRAHHSFSPPPNPAHLSFTSR